jgi:Fe-S cluster assembly protein SufB
LNENIVRYISKQKNEPAFMLEWRLKAYRKWLTMKEPDWAKVDYPPIDYQDIFYYASPKKKKLQSMDEVDPEIRSTFNKLGISLDEQKKLSGVEVAVDAVLDSVSVVTTFRSKLAEQGVIFCPIRSRNKIFNCSKLVSR